METIVSCLSLTKHRRNCDLHSNNCVCLLKQTTNIQRQSGWLVLWEEEEVWVEASTESGEADHIGLKINCHDIYDPTHKFSEKTIEVVKPGSDELVCTRWEDRQHNQKDRNISHHGFLPATSHIYDVLLSDGHFERVLTWHSAFWPQAWSQGERQL